MITEQEAKTKRCPMPMGVMNDSRVMNHCIASGCMAWRTNDPMMREVDEGPRGYCGLAGHPFPAFVVPHAR